MSDPPSLERRPSALQRLGHDFRNIEIGQTTRAHLGDAYYVGKTALQDEL